MFTYTYTLHLFTRTHRIIILRYILTYDVAKFGPYIFYRAGSMTRFCLIYTHAYISYNTPETRRSRWSRTTGDVVVGVTPLYACVHIIIIYIRNDNNIILYSTYRKIWTGSIKFNAPLALIYYSRRLY